MNNKQWLIAIVIGVGVLALLSPWNTANAQPLEASARPLKADTFDLEAFEADLDTTIGALRDTLRGLYDNGTGNISKYVYWESIPRGEGTQLSPRGVLITFTDGADLLRQYREIAGACDTVIAIDAGFVVGANPDSIYWGDKIRIVRVDSIMTALYLIWYETSDTTIRYRKNVRITIIPEYWLERSVTLEYSSPKKHQAIITWEWTE